MERDQDSIRDFLEVSANSVQHSSVEVCLTSATQMWGEDKSTARVIHVMLDIRIEGPDRYKMIAKMMGASSGEPCKRLLAPHTVRMRAHCARWFLAARLYRRNRITSLS